MKKIIILSTILFLISCEQETENSNIEKLNTQFEWTGNPATHPIFDFWDMDRYGGGGGGGSNVTIYPKWHDMDFFCKIIPENSEYYSYSWKLELSDGSKTISSIKLPVNASGPAIDHSSVIRPSWDTPNNSDPNYATGWFLSLGKYIEPENTEEISIDNRLNPTNYSIYFYNGNSIQEDLTIHGTINKSDAYLTDQYSNYNPTIIEEEAIRIDENNIFFKAKIIQAYTFNYKIFANDQVLYAEDIVAGKNFEVNFTLNREAYGNNLLFDSELIFRLEVYKLMHLEKNQTYIKAKKANPVYTTVQISNSTVSVLPPTTLTSLTFQNSNPKLIWETRAGASYYKIQRAIGNSAFSDYATITTNQFIDSWREAANTGYEYTWYRVIVVYDNNNSQASNHLSLKTVEKEIIIPD